jgi:hypothetical protein
LLNAQASRQWRSAAIFSDYQAPKHAVAGGKRQFKAFDQRIGYRLEAISEVGFAGILKGVKGFRQSYGPSTFKINVDFRGSKTNFEITPH